MFFSIEHLWDVLPARYLQWVAAELKLLQTSFFHQIQMCHSETLLIHAGIPLRSFPTSLIHLPQATCHLSVHSVHGSTLPTAFQDGDGQARRPTVGDEGRTEEPPLSASGSTCLQSGLKRVWLVRSVTPLSLFCSAVS